MAFHLTPERYLTLTPKVTRFTKGRTVGYVALFIFQELSSVSLGSVSMN